jgi:hypothetical protein
MCCAACARHEPQYRNSRIKSPSAGAFCRLHNDRIVTFLPSFLPPPLPSFLLSFFPLRFFLSFLPSFLSSFFRFVFVLSSCSKQTDSGSGGIHAARSIERQHSCRGSSRESNGNRGASRQVGKLLWVDGRADRVHIQQTKYGELRDEQVVVRQAALAPQMLKLE